jgi:flagellar basal-body rod protein FlgF
MVRGFYTAASGLFSQQKAINVISNNIANSTTAGFKTQSTMESSFGDHLVARLSAMEGVSENNIGPGSYMTVNSSEYTDFTQGSVEGTGRNVDMAINGQGFFLVESETNGPVLTRNGQFEIDSDGELSLPGVGKVLNDGENTISIESSNFTVSPKGVISVGGEEVDTLAVMKPGEEAVMKSVGNGVFQCDEYDQAEAGTYTVLQDAIEKSNINGAQEMSKLIAGQNHFSSCAQVIKMYDSINELAVNQIGKIG